MAETTSTAIVTTDKLMSPYYLHPSDNTGQVQTPILLNGANYERWSKLMTNSLRAKRKTGFIDGTLKRPSNTSDDAEKWDMVNSMIIGWIYSSVEPKLRPSISLVDSAKAMWASLQRRFSVNDDTRVHQLLADITSCKQESDTVEIFFGRLKVMWDDLADLEKGFTCCCGSSECNCMVKFEKSQEKIRVHQFFMGLDHTRFGKVRSNLLSRQTELSLEAIYSQIIQEERHLNSMRNNDERIPTVGFSATTQTSVPRSTTEQAAAAKFTRPTTVCTHCGKTGHESSNCFQIIGFPEWYTERNKTTGGRSSRGRGSETGRGRGGRGSGFRANNTLIRDTAQQEPQSPGIPTLTPDQWVSLTNFINSQKQSSSDKSSGKTEKLYLYGTYSKYDIIIDSGASHHMTGDVSLLSNITDIAPRPISLPNGELTWATKHGALRLGKRLLLTDVLYAPNMTITLISVAQLLRDIAGFVLFTKRFCVIQDLISKTLIGAGKERDGVYHYTGEIEVSNAGRLQSRELWHRRLGHPSSAVLSSLSDIGGFSHRVEVFEKSCDICVRAKQTRGVFSQSNNKADGSFSLIHCDLWGPYKTPSSRGARYFLTIVDDYTRAVWTILLLEKKEAPNALKVFCTRKDCTQ